MGWLPILRLLPLGLGRKDCIEATLFAQVLLVAFQRLAILQDKDHSRPFRSARVLPRMHRRTLDCDVALLQQSLASIVQLH